MGNILATTDLIEESINNLTKAGNLARTCMENEEEIPDIIIARMIKEKLKAIETTHGMIIDGWPRTLD